MKKIILNNFIICIILFSCTKSNDTTTTSNTTSTTTSNSVGTAFTNTSVKSIFDKCSSCHSSGQSDSKKWLYNPNDYETSIKGNISNIYSTVKTTSSSMSIKANLNSNEVVAINTWYNAGYPAK